MMLFQFVLCALTFQAFCQAVVKERILFGGEAVEGQFSYQVKLKIAWWLSVVRTDCGGSLISNKHVLTAAHCLQNAKLKSPHLVAIAVGSIYSKDLGLEAALATSFLNLQLKDIQVCGNCWVLHQDYKGHPPTNDIAIITLPQEVQFSNAIKAIKLPSKSDNESDIIGGSALSLGWGKTERNGLSDTLRYTNLTFANQSLCKSYNVPENHLCAKRNFNEPTICKGDMGGPVVVDDKQVAISSYVLTSVYEDKTCGSVYLTAYTNVFSYLDWINNTAGINYT